jgi:PAS domain S-box-containing protein
MGDLTKIETFVQSSPHPAWLANSQGECVYANAALVRLIGLNSDQINQVDWWNFLLEEDRVAATASWRKSLANGSPYRVRVRMRGFDGVPATVELIAFGNKLTDDMEEPWLFIGLRVDSASHQNASLEAQLQATLNVIPAYTWYAAPSGGLTFVNQRTADYLGLPKDHPLRFGIAVAAPWDSHLPFLHPDDREETRRVWSNCLRTGSAGEVSFRVRDSGGGYRWFLSRAEPLRAGDGTLLYCIGINLDIQERKQAEFYLAEGQRLAHMGSWAFNAAGFDYWSPELFRIHGLGASGKAPTVEEYLALVHPEDRESVAQEIQKMLATHRGFDFTKRIVRPDGQTRRVRCVGVPTTHGDTFQAFVGTGIDVTEQDQLTEDLRRSEYYLAEGQRLARMGSWAFNPSGFFDYWSRELFQIYGLDPSNKPPTLDEYLALIHPEDRESMATTIQTILAESLGCDLKKRIVRPNGEVRHIRCVGVPVVDHGKLKRIIGTAVDVTEQEHLTQELRRREAYLAEAQKLSHTGSFEWRVQTGEIVWSDETFRIFEFDPTAKPTLQLIIERIHPDDRAVVQQTLDRVCKERANFDIEHRLLMPDGSVKHLHVLARALQNSSGELEFVGAATDVTAAKQAEEALRKSEQQWRDVFENNPTMYFMVDAQGIVLAVNPFGAEQLGYNVDELVGQPVLSVSYELDREAAQRNVAECLKQIGHSMSWELRKARKNGSVIWVRETARAVLRGNDRVVLIACEDITERKSVEDKIRQQEIELRQMLDLTPQHVHVLAADASLVYSNEVAIKYHGATLEDWRERPLAEWRADELPFNVFHPDDRERLMRELKNKFLSGSPHETEARLLRDDGKYRWFLFRFNPLRDSQGRVMRWFVAGTDIEDRKQGEERLQHENVALREEIDKASMFEEIVGASPVLQTVLSRVSKVAPTDSTVLITGETGTGKELVARAIHRRSQRSSRAFVSVNCAAIPRDLIASELFGHEKGAFTGATQRRLGRFELAGGGTIFLDEVGELPAETQVALLRVLQEHEFERVGGTRSIQTDVRVIAATNRDLQAAIAEGTFRSDLFYRLNVFPIDIPSLRERAEDIPLLVEYFIDRFARKAGKSIRGVSKKTLELLQSYPWPGNIRELQNVIERSVIVCETENFSVDESWLSRQPTPTGPAKSPLDLSEKLAAQEREIIEAALRESRGQVFGPSGAATKLGMPRSTLESKIRSLKINKNLFRS